MFTVKEVLEATEGKLINPNQEKLKEIVARISIDSRTVQKGDLFFAIKGERHNGHNFLEEVVSEGARIILVENEEVVKGKFKDATSIRVNSTRDALGKLAHFARRKINPTVIAVVGSNGKTTAKDMIYHLLVSKHRITKNEGTKNNHIGMSLTLLNMDEKSDFAVLEMGANHFGEIAGLAKIAEPDAGVITNIGQAHLEYFQNQDNVFKEKISLIEYLRPRRILAVNSDDRYLNKINFKDKITFGFSEEAQFYASKINFVNGGYEFLLNGKFRFRLNGLGLHNIYNALAAIAVAKHYGLSFKEIRESLSTFKFPEMRLEYICIKGIDIINDAYNSNPDSLKAAVDTLANLSCNKRKILATADMLELGKESAHLHRDIGKYIASKGEIDMLISVGNFSENVAQGARERGMDDKNIKSFKSLDDSIEQIASFIKSGDILLVKGSRLMQMERLVRAIKENSK